MDEDSTMASLYIINSRPTSMANCSAMRSAGTRYLIPVPERVFKGYLGGCEATTTASLLLTINERLNHCPNQINMCPNQRTWPISGYK